MKRLVFAACLAATPAVAQSNQSEMQAFMGLFDQALQIIGTGTCAQWLEASTTDDLAPIIILLSSIFAGGYAAASDMESEEVFTQIMENCRENPERLFVEALQ